MTMPVCCVDGCNNRTGLKKTATQKELEQKTKITFHSIPKDPMRRNKWIEAISRADWTPAKTSSICSTHFQDKHFDRTSLSCVRLRETAIPTIFNKAPPLKKENRFRRNIQRTRFVGIGGSSVDVTRNHENAQILYITSSEFFPLIEDEDILNLNLSSTSNISEKNKNIRKFKPRTISSPIRRKQKILSPSKAVWMNRIQIIKQMYIQKIRVLQQSKRLKEKKITTLLSVLNSSKQQKLLQDQEIDILRNIYRPNSDLLKPQ